VLENDRSHRYAVLTFDDGYRDNVSMALPILERHNAPFLNLCADGPTSANLTGVVARIALRGRYSGASIL
jgi:peptidoglycan/xylan/chitin deacetylase (PgdA/CDA1 family)